MKNCNQYRVALAVQIAGLLTMTITISSLTRLPGLTIGLFLLSWLPILSYLGTFSLWRPWWLEQTEQPDTRPIWATSAAFDVAVIVGALTGLTWPELLTISIVGILSRLTIVGRYKSETVIEEQ